MRRKAGSFSSLLKLELLEPFSDLFEDSYECMTWFLVDLLLWRVTARQRVRPFIVKRLAPSEGSDHAPWVHVR